MNVTDCLKTTFNCTSASLACHNDAGFDFKILWNVTVNYSTTCPEGPLLFKFPGSIVNGSAKYLALTNEACKAIAGPTWRKYPGDAIWQRLSTWKLPLFQLLANSPRPPLGFWVEVLTFVHLLGDPMSTISDLLCKIDACQRRAVFWQDQLDWNLIRVCDGRTQAERERLWRYWTIIVDSFDEWGPEAGDQAQEYLLTELIELNSPDTKIEHVRHIEDIIKRTSNALAADRSTMSVPVVVSQFFFICSIAVAMLRTKATGSGPNATTFVQIEIYSIGFTAQFFWVIFAVCWTSIIGASQTAAAIPHILKRFCDEMKSSCYANHSNTTLPEVVLQNKDQRIYNGGVYSWQPGRQWAGSVSRGSESRVHRFPSSKPAKLRDRIWVISLQLWPFVRHLLPFLIVGSASATGILLSALVPPEGWSLRAVAMGWMFIVWLTSHALSLIPFGKWQRTHFWATLLKDVLATATQVGIILVTQFGIYNTCDAYTKWGRTGLQLPYMPAVDYKLQSRLDTLYPTVVATGIAVQLIFFPGLVIWRYYAAVQVFLQRDDEDHHCSWLHNIWTRWKRLRKS